MILRIELLGFTPTLNWNGNDLQFNLDESASKNSGNDLENPLELSAKHLQEKNIQSSTSQNEDSIDTAEPNREITNKTEVFEWSDFGIHQRKLRESYDSSDQIAQAREAKSLPYSWTQSLIVL